MCIYSLKHSGQQSTPLITSQPVKQNITKLKTAQIMQNATEIMHCKQYHATY